jgi:hypothetical protein
VCSSDLFAEYFDTVSELRLLNGRLMVHLEKK